MFDLIILYVNFEGMCLVSFVVFGLEMLGWYVEIGFVMYLKFVYIIKGILSCFDWFVYVNYLFFLEGIFVFCVLWIW